MFNGQHQWASLKNVHVNVCCKFNAFALDCPQAMLQRQWPLPGALCVHHSTDFDQCQRILYKTTEDSKHV